MSEVVSIPKAVERMKALEVWPFNDADNGCLLIQEDRFYGFYDCGGVTDNNGFATLDEAIAAIQKDFDDAYSTTTLITTDPEQLGVYAVAVLSGRQFVDRLYEICGYSQELFHDYGTWSCKENP